MAGINRSSEGCTCKSFDQKQCDRIFWNTTLITRLLMKDEVLLPEIPLHTAVKTQHICKVKRLLNLGTSVDNFDNFHCTELHYAVQNENIEIIKLLLQKGASINSCDEFGNTPLSQAMLKCDYDLQNPKVFKIIRLLSTKAADTRLSIENFAASLKFSFKCKNNIFFQNVLGKRILDGDDRNHEGETAFHFVAAFPHTEMLHALVYRHADVRAKSKNGETPLHMAAATGSIAIVTCLLSYGADPNAQTNDGSTPLHYLLERCKSYQVRKLDLPKDNNFPVSKQLFRACLKIVQLLLNAKAKVDVRDKFGKTPLHYAVTMKVFTSKNSPKSRSEIVKLLLNYGADINALCNNNLRPIHYAIHAKNMTILWWLICRGSKIKIALKDTIISFIQPPMWMILLECGVSIDVENYQPQSILEVMRSQNCSSKIFDVLALQELDASIVIKVLILMQKVSHLAAEVNSRMITILVHRKLAGEISFSEGDLVEAPQYLRKGFIQCEREINHMKKVKISEDLRFYDIISWPTKKLVEYGNLEELSGILKYKTIQDTYPTCLDWMKMRIKKAEKARTLIVTSVKMFTKLIDSLLKIKLPDPVARKIVMNLNFIDMSCLCV